ARSQQGNESQHEDGRKQRAEREQEPTGWLSPEHRQQHNRKRGVDQCGAESEVAERQDRNGEREREPPSRPNERERAGERSQAGEPTGWRPASASHRSTPTAQTSAAGVAGSPPSRSGEMYASVPGTSPAAVSVSACGSRASPKSSSRTEMRSPSAIRTFEGLTSRWTIP